MEGLANPPALIPYGTKVEVVAPVVGEHQKTDRLVSMTGILARGFTADLLGDTDFSTEPNGYRFKLIDPKTKTSMHAGELQLGPNSTITVVTDQQPAKGRVQQLIEDTGGLSLDSPFPGTRNTTDTSGQETQHSAQGDSEWQNKCSSLYGSNLVIALNENLSLSKDDKVEVTPYGLSVTWGRFDAQRLSTFDNNPINLNTVRVAAISTDNEKGISTITIKSIKSLSKTDQQAKKECLGVLRTREQRALTIVTNSAFFGDQSISYSVNTAELSKWLGVLDAFDEETISKSLTDQENKKIAKFKQALKESHPLVNKTADNLRNGKGVESEESGKLYELAKQSAGKYIIQRESVDFRISSWFS